MTMAFLPLRFINMKKLFALLMIFSINLMAQQINSISNFMNNQLVYSPASAGMNSAQLNFSTLTRFQFVTIKGAPRLGLGWIDYRTPSRKMGVGLVMSSFKQGGYSSTDINLNYAYYINLNEATRLAMGLRAGFSNVRNSTDNYVIWDENDPYEVQNNYSTIIPKFGTGFQLNGKKYYVNFSLPDLMTLDRDNYVVPDSTSFLKQKRNYMLMAGNVIVLNDLYNLRPNVLFQYYSKENGFNTRLNLSFEIKDYFTLGATYSTIGSFGINAGSQISRRMKFNYSYDLFTASTTGNFIGAHEINLLLNMDNLVRRKSNDE
jgi:type IX secretion system PorP/SprF family membrane protein